MLNVLNSMRMSKIDELTSKTHKGSNDEDRVDSIKCYTFLTHHIAGMFGIDFDFLINSISHYSIQFERESAEYTTTLDNINYDNHGINIHLESGDVISINDATVNRVVNEVTAEHIFKDFEVNDPLMQKMSESDFRKVREKFNEIIEGIENSDEIKSSYRGDHHFNIIGLSSIYLLFNKDDRISVRLFLAQDIANYLNDVEVLYKKLIYDLYSFNCEFNILEYIKGRDLMGDKMPVMRDILKALIGKRLFNKIKFLDQAFYMKLELKANNWFSDSYTIKFNSYSSKLENFYLINELSLIEYISNEIIFILDNLDNHITDNTLMFSKDGNI